MTNSFGKIFLFAIFLQCSFITSEFVGEYYLDGTTESEKADDWHEHDDSHDIFLQRLEEIYQNGTHELKEFIESASTTLSKRLDILERNNLVQAIVHKSSGNSSDDVCSQKLQVYFQNGLPDKSDTLQSSWNQRLDLFEKKIILSFDKFSVDFETFKLEFKRRDAELDKQMEELNRRVDQVLNNTLGTQALETGISNPSKQLIATTPRPRTPEEYLSFASPPTIGSSFNFQTIEEIAAEVPGEWTVVCEIVNYLDMNLTNYQLYNPYGSALQRAPSTVSYKTREVFTFQHTSGQIPHGALLYRVGDTGYSMHLVFFVEKFGIGFLENSAPVTTIYSITGGCNKYTHKGAPGSMKCIQDFAYGRDNAKNVTIHQGNIFAKLSVRSIKGGSYRIILSMEIFQFKL